MSCLWSRLHGMQRSLSMTVGYLAQSGYIYHLLDGAFCLGLLLLFVTWWLCFETYPS